MAWIPTASTSNAPFADGTTPNGVFATKLMFRQLIEVEKLARTFG